MVRSLGLILFAGFVLLLVPAPALSWTQTYSWSVVATATSYKVEKSVDNGVTWVVAGTPATPTFAYTGTETGLVLFRISACNANACTLRPTDGLWHNDGAQFPLAPTNLSGQ